MTASPQGKADRAIIWKEIDALTAQIDKMSEQFTDAENKTSGSKPKSCWSNSAPRRTRPRRSRSRPMRIRQRSCCSRGIPLADAMFSELGKMIAEEETWRSRLSAENC